MGGRSFSITIAEESPFRFDPATFAGWLAERWPGVSILPGDLDLDLLAYHLPRCPAYPVLDPEGPNGLRWMPVFRLAVDPLAPSGARKLSELDDSSLFHYLVRNGRTLTIVGAGVLDCAISAVWLRTKVPVEIPLYMWEMDAFVHVPVPPGISAYALAAHYLATVAIEAPGPEGYA